MTTTIWFDMDGTIADLYGVEGWLKNLRNKETKPYREAKALVNMKAFTKAINEVQAKGYKVGIISWLAKFSNEEYDERVTVAKIQWLQKRCPHIEWNEINIVEYGYCKNNFNHGNDILFDDECGNREAWSGQAYDVHNIIEILTNLKENA